MMQWFYPQCQRVYVPSQSMIDELGVEGITGDMDIWARGIDTQLFNPEKEINNGEKKWVSLRMIL